MQAQSRRAKRGASYGRFQPLKRLLLGPGPSPVDDRVLAAMAAPLLGHLDPLFLRCMDDVQGLKGRIWRIGLMGSGSTRENVILVLDALHWALNAERFSCASGTGAAEELCEQPTAVLSKHDLIRFCSSGACFSSLGW